MTVHYISPTLALPRSFAKGVEAALDQGLRVIPFTFREVTTDVCGSARRFFEEVGLEVTDECTEKSSHMDSVKGDKKKLTLEDRVGPTIAALFRAEFSGGKHAWMLDLEPYDKSFKDWLDTWREDAPYFTSVMDRAYAAAGKEARRTLTEVPVMPVTA